MVVLPDADLDLAADAAVAAGFGSAGERCMAQTLVIAVGDVGERLRPMILERIARLKIGDGMEPGADMGPIYSAEHRDVDHQVDRRRRVPRAPSSSSTGATFHRPDHRTASSSA